MNKRIAFTLVMMLLLATLAPAQAGRRVRPGVVNSLRFGLHMAENNLFEARFILRQKDELGLSAAQQKKIEDLMLAYEEGAIRAGSDIKVLELKFATLLRAGSVDRHEMERMVRSIGGKRTDLQVNHLNYLLDVRAVLNPEQVRKLEKMKRSLAPFPFHGRPGEKDRPVMAPPPPGGDDEPEPDGTEG
ncbi:MAG TPA: periplasmic heavy metal sensor [Candidatus Aminicenantes bacterium]|nr:periplasmic heavy metal sensor [Candidatus Aminicenantes bacterium]